MEKIKHLEKVEIFSLKSKKEVPALKRNFLGQE